MPHASGLHIEAHRRQEVSVSLKSAVETPYVNPRGRTCKVGSWIATLPEDEQGFAHELIEQARRGERPIASVAVAFQDEGYSGQRTTVERHFHGECACP